MPSFAIDCYDPRPPGEAIAVRHGDAEFRFVFAPRAKKGMVFHAGLFVDEAAANTRACYRYPRSRRICLLKESPIKPFYGQVDIFEKRYDQVFTFDRQLLDRGSPFQLLYYGSSWLGNGWQAVNCENTSKTKLVSFIGNIEHEDAHGYALRRQVALCLQRDGRAECFGRGIRWIGSKLEGLQPFCFSVAMENTQKDYYFTEKLVDCLLTETVPVYWGCPSLGGLFDLRGVLPFDTLDELLAVLGSLSVERYRAMLPFVQRNKQLVLDNHWESNEGLFYRLASHLSRWLDPRPGFRKHLRGRPAAVVRWLMSAGFLERRCRAPASPHALG